MENNSDPRRTIESHIKSLEFDFDRKILVVEGREDRLFLEYLTDNNLKNTIILEIDSVKIEKDVKGGNRGRILYFSSLSENERVKFLIDRDYSMFTNEVFKNNVILTDYKDLESYLYEEVFMQKFIKLGLKTEKIDAEHLLNELFKARFFGILRITSILYNLNLSVNKTNERFSKYIEIDKGLNVNIKEKEYFISVISNSNIKPKFSELEVLFNDTQSNFSGVENRLIVHGKDAIQLVSEISAKLGIVRENIENILWMSFDSTLISKFPNLQYTLDFIKN